MGFWEKIHNPNFNYGEYAIIRNQAGLNNYKISVKEWAVKTNAIGLTAKAGRYGGEVSQACGYCKIQGQNECILKEKNRQGSRICMTESLF